MWKASGFLILLLASNFAREGKCNTNLTSEPSYETTDKNICDSCYPDNYDEETSLPDCEYGECDCYNYDDECYDDYDEATPPTCEYGEDDCYSDDDEINGAYDSPCKDSTEMSTTNYDYECDSAYEQYLGVIALYGFKFLKAAIDQFPGTTIIISSWKIFQFTILLYIFAEGKFKTDIYNVTKIKDKKEAECVALKANEFIDSIKSGSIYRATVNAVNNEHYKLTKKAIAKTNLIEGKPYQLNFSKTAETSKILNNYLNTQTKSLVGDVIPSNVVNSSTQLIAGDALYSLIELAPIIKVTGPVYRNFVCALFKVRSIEYFLVEAYTDYVESKSLMASIIILDTTAGYRATLIVPNRSFDAKKVLTNINGNIDMYNKEKARVKKQHLTITIPNSNGKLNKVYDGTNSVKQFLPFLFDDKAWDVKDYYTGNKSLALTRGYQRITLEIGFSNKTMEAPKTSQKSKPKLIELKYPFIFIIDYKGINIYTAIYNGCDL